MIFGLWDDALRHCSAETLTHVAMHVSLVFIVAVWFSSWAFYWIGHWYDVPKEGPHSSRICSGTGCLPLAEATRHQLNTLHLYRQLSWYHPERYACASSRLFPCRLLWNMIEKHMFYNNVVFFLLSSVDRMRLLHCY